VPDEQAMAEASLTLLTEAMSGNNIIHDVGYLGAGNCYSLEQLVMCDEMINWVRRFMQGIEID
jgi:trimethylamine--corrinoid protein Co-methyltransferase